MAIDNARTIIKPAKSGEISSFGNVKPTIETSMIPSGKGDHEVARLLLALRKEKKNSEQTNQEKESENRTRGASSTRRTAKR